MLAVTLNVSCSLTGHGSTFKIRQSWTGAGCDFEPFLQRQNIGITRRWFLVSSCLDQIYSATGEISQPYVYRSSSKKFSASFSYDWLFVWSIFCNWRSLMLLGHAQMARSCMRALTPSKRIQGLWSILPFKLQSLVLRCFKFMFVLWLFKSWDHVCEELAYFVGFLATGEKKPNAIGHVTG